MAERLYVKRRQVSPVVSVALVRWRSWVVISAISPTMRELVLTTPSKLDSVQMLALIWVRERYAVDYNLLVIFTK